MRWTHLIHLMFAIVLGLAGASPAQDSLHLAMTLTGESYAKRITDAVGVGDVNGDGYCDFAVSRPGSVRLYLGGAKFDTSRFVEFHIGGNVAGAGDVNGDGYDDILIASQFNSGGERKGIVRLYLGGRDIDTTADFSFYDKKTGMDAMGSVSGAGDVNGDGYDDFLIGEPYNWTDATGKAYLFLGGTTLSTEPAVIFASDNMEDFFGYSVEGVGDINRDGFDEFIISQPTFLMSTKDSGKVYVYLGAKEITAIPDTVFTGPSEGAVIAGGGDINGDDYPDVMLGFPTVICYGSNASSNLHTTPFNMSKHFSNYGSIAIDGDVDGDGISDVFMGDGNHRNKDSIMVGAAYIYLGGGTMDTVPGFYMEGETKWSGFGYSVFFLGDYNGDGYDEVAVLAPSYPDTTGSGEACLGKVYIYSYKKTDAIKNRQEPLDPESFHLKQNYPNPFNPTTIIEYQIMRRSKVLLKVFDVLGREIATLVDQPKPAGEFKVQFDANTYRLSSGVYFYELVVGNRRTVKTMMFLK